MILRNHVICSARCVSIVSIWIFHTIPVAHTLQNESKNSLKWALIGKPIGAGLDTYTSDTIEALLCELLRIYATDSVVLIQISLKNYQNFQENFCFCMGNYQNLSNHYCILYTSISQQNSYNLSYKTLQLVY